MVDSRFLLNTIEKLEKQNEDFREALEHDTTLECVNKKCKKCDVLKEHEE